MSVGRIRAGLENMDRVDRLAQEILAKRRLKEVEEAALREKEAAMIEKLKQNPEISEVWIDELRKLDEDPELAQKMAAEVDPERDSRLDRVSGKAAQAINAANYERLAGKSGADRLLSSHVEALQRKLIAEMPKICGGCDLKKFVVADPRRDFMNDRLIVEVSVKCAAPRCVKDEQHPIRVHGIGPRRASKKPQPKPEPEPIEAPRTTYGDW
jgi:hypothetical protein